MHVFSIVQILLMFYVIEMSSLVLEKVIVPFFKKVGDSAILECRFDLEGEPLYSVKWYKENEEFYRYTPVSRTTVQTWRVAGTKVDENKSNSTHLYLRAVNLKSSALYRCEVSAEKPAFVSKQAGGYLSVILSPMRAPEIQGTDSQYSIGEDLDLNCTSAKSYPAQTLRWYINNELVPEDDPKVTNYPPTVHQHGAIQSLSSIHTIIADEYFQNREMRVRCEASFAPTVWMGTKESTVIEHKIFRSKEASFLRASGNSVTLHTGLLLATLFTTCLLVHVIFSATSDVTSC
uniref:Ig-like domain-containing protein n=1 Tax=Cacopsylla melanoneura TaxID=428564 RepID=A0A8D9F5U3_9HEMI